MKPHPEEPHRNEPKAPQPRPEEKQKRFRLIKLEERIAPRKGTNDSVAQGYLSIE
jgi:hypothetical protein